MIGIPISIWLMILFARVAVFIAARAPFGRQAYAIEGNERAAEISGVQVNRVEEIVYVISGFCFAMSGRVVASWLVASHPASRTTFELTGIALAALGGMSLLGSRGAIGGTIVGAYVIGVLGDGMNMWAAAGCCPQVIRGMGIVVAVASDQFQTRIQVQHAL